MRDFFHESVRKKIDDILNGNQRGVLFDVSLYFGEDNSKFFKVKEVKNSLLGEYQSYCSVGIEGMSVDRQPIPNKKVLTLGVQSSILIPLEKQADLKYNNETFDNIFTTIEEQIEEYNAKTLPLGSPKYDFINAVVKFTNQANRAVKSLGTTLYIDKDINGVILETSTTSTNGIKISVVNGEFEIALGRTGGGPDIHTLPIEQEENEILVYLKESNLIELYINMNKYEFPLVSGTYNLSASTHEIKKYQGYIKNLYLQEAEFIDYKEYEKGEITFDGLFNDPYVNVQNFVTLDNLVESDTVITLESGRVIEFGTDGIITFTFDTIEPITGQFSMQGTKYQQFDFTFNAIVTKDVYNDSQIKYYIDDVEIFPLSNNSSLTNENASEQMLNTNLSETVNATTGMQHEYTLFYERNTKVIELIETIKKDITRNTVYKLRFEYPTFEDEYDVIISDFGKQRTYGEPSTFTLSFDMAGQILLEE